MPNSGYPYPESSTVPFGALRNGKIEKFSTGEIAYKVNSALLVPFLIDFLPLPDGSEEIDLSNTGIIGIQFEFKEEISPNNFTPLDYIKVSQILCDYSKIGTGNPYTRRTQQMPHLFAANKMAHLIMKHERPFKAQGQPLKNSWYTIDSETTDEPYESLEFFTSDVVLVYFAKNQIKPILDHFECVIISGSQVEFGKKLNKHAYTDDIAVKKGSYFNLKIEGAMEVDLINEEGPFDNKLIDPFVPGPDKVISTPIQGQVNKNPIAGRKSFLSRGEGTSSAEGAIESNTEEAAIVPDVLLGHRCPPDWYLIKKILADTAALAPPEKQALLHDPQIQRLLSQNIIDHLISHQTTNNSIIHG